MLALVAKHADQAFVQDVVAERGRGAVTRDARIRIERHRRSAVVDHLVLDGEQVFVVDGDGASEFQPLAVVVDEGHRPADGERSAALLPPDRVRRRNFGRGSRFDQPAEFGIERLRAARGREQHDRGRMGVDRLVIFDEREIVDASALERDRARNARRLDRTRGEAASAASRVIGWAGTPAGCPGACGVAPGTDWVGAVVGGAGEPGAGGTRSCACCCCICRCFSTCGRPK